MQEFGEATPSIETLFPNLLIDNSFPFSDFHDKSRGGGVVVGHPLATPPNRQRLGGLILSDRVSLSLSPGVAVTLYHRIHKIPARHLGDSNSIRAPTPRSGATAWTAVLFVGSSARLIKDMWP